MSGNAVVCFVSFAKTINDAPWLRFWAQAVGFLQLLKLKRKKKKRKKVKSCKLLKVSIFVGGTPPSHPQRPPAALKVGHFGGRQLKAGAHLVSLVGQVAWVEEAAWLTW